VGTRQRNTDAGDTFAFMASFRLTRKAPREARRWLDRSTDLTPDLRDRARLLVSEVVANSVRHSGLGPDDSVEVRADPVGRGVHVEVRDEGTGFDPYRAIGPRRFGLRLVDAESDAWGVSLQPTRVWFDVRDRKAS
jgi:anti-sigma regulatory factor (Ser/Thr protein kinase)